MNVEILTLIARKIDETRRDKWFKAPFQPLWSKHCNVGDDDNLVMNGAPLPSAIEKRTLASDKARSIDGSEED